MTSVARTFLLLVLLGASACEQAGNRSLREGLDGLPRDTASEVALEPVQIDTAPATVPFEFPDSGIVSPGPMDTEPWIPLDRMHAPPGEWTTRAAGREGTGGMTVMGGARTARHPGFDRVVLEFLSGDAPGYRVEYVDMPVAQCGSGNPVNVAGDAALRVRLEPSQAHDDNGRPTLDRRSFRVDGQVVMEMRLICDFEGQVEWLIGVRGSNPYRVLELSSPARIVIDVQSDDAMPI